MDLYGSKQFVHRGRKVYKWRQRTIIECSASGCSGYLRVTRHRVPNADHIWTEFECRKCRRVSIWGYYPMEPVYTTDIVSVLAAALPDRRSAVRHQRRRGKDSRARIWTCCERCEEEIRLLVHIDTTGEHEARGTCKCGVLVTIEFGGAFQVDAPVKGQWGSYKDPYEQWWLDCAPKKRRKSKRR